MTYDPAKYTRAEINFPYSELPHRISEQEFASYCARMQPACALIAKTLTPESNGQWLTRNYLSVKLIFGATVMLSSLEYAEGRNLKVVEPYLTYYGILNAARAWYLTMPTQQWGTGDRLLAPSHRSLLNIVVSELSRISDTLGGWGGEITSSARRVRELFSYKFPAQGLKGAAGNFSVVSEDALLLSRLFAELAQANSEILERALERYVDQAPGYSEMFLNHVFTYSVSDTRSIIDRDDKLRIRQIMRSGKHPSNLYLSVREGFVDDLFGAWEEDAPDDDSYQPYDGARIIYPFP